MARREGIKIKPLLTADQVAEKLAVSRQTIYHLICQRKIPFLKLGRRVRFDPIQIEEWLDAEKIPPNGEGKNEF